MICSFCSKEKKRDEVAVSKRGMVVLCKTCEETIAPIIEGYVEVTIKCTFCEKEEEYKGKTPGTGIAICKACAEIIYPIIK